MVGAEYAIRELRDAIGSIIASIPGFSYGRPNDLAVELGLDPKLAWNVGRCLEGSDQFASAKYIPGPTGMRTLLRAAKRRNAPEEVLEQTRSAFESFHELVQKHAGSRKHFNMLAAGLSITDSARADLEHRRMLFDGSTYIWGVQARTLFRTYIVRPSDENAATYDLATVRGLVDFTRMRPNIAWRFTLPSSTDDDEITRANVVHVALDPRVKGSVPMLSNFCTHPLPEFRRRADSGNTREFELVESSVGISGRATYVVGELLPQLEPRYHRPLYRDFCVYYVIRTPARNLVCDLLIHRDLFPDRDPPSVELYSDLFNYGIVIKYTESDRMPVHETLERLGDGSEAAFTPEIPRYPEMLRYVLDRVGWNGVEFDFYRLRMQYPPIHTTLMLRKPLPEPG